MHSKERNFRYKRILVELTTLEGGHPKESPLLDSPDPNINDGAPMEQARPMSLDYHSRVSSKASLEAKQTMIRELRNTLNVVSGSSQDNALLCLEVYLDLYHLYGFDFSRFNSLQLDRQVLKSLGLLEEFLKRDDWLSYFKWKNAAFFSYWMGQVQPAPPKDFKVNGWEQPGFLFGGPFYAFLKRGMRCQEFRRSFSLSILQSKKGMPRPTDKMVRAAEVKSFNTMTTLKMQENFVYKWVAESSKEVVPPAMLRHYTDCYNPFDNELTYDREYFRGQIKRTTREVFHGADFSLDLLTHYCLPSSSANYNWSRGKTGTYAALEDLVDKETGTKLLDLLKTSEIAFKLKLTKLTGYVSEYYGAKGQEDELLNNFEESCREVVGLEVDDAAFLRKWRIFYWNCVRLALEEEPRCQVVGLKEALKIRCISKGPPVTYFVLKPFQKLMWKQLQKFWNFELTGTPITTELMNRRFGRLGPNYRLHSGDYSSATDELHSWASEQFCDSFFEVAEKSLGFSMGPFSELFKRALTGHIYVDEELGEKPQMRGQLMGSIISFPVLCIANFAMSRAAWEVAHQRVLRRITDYPIWINGDDILTAYLNLRYPSVWKGFGNVMGLSESVGKTYDSKVFCSINSHFFMQDENARWFLIPYVNLGLMDGVERSTGGVKSSSEKNGTQLGTVHRELMKTVPLSLREAVHNDFLYRHFNQLKEFPGPWFLPSYMGGAGLQPIDPYTVSELQRVTLARELLSRGLKVPVDASQKDWMLYDNFNKVVREFNPLSDSYYYRHYENDTEYSKAFFMVTLWTWANCGISMLLKKQLKKNGAFVRKLRQFNDIINDYQKESVKSGRWVVPADPDWVIHEFKETVVPVWAGSGVA